MLDTGIRPENEEDNERVPDQGRRHSAGRATARALHVEHLQSVDGATWDGLLQESPGGGHVLQTYAWGEVKRAQGWLPVRLALKDGDEVRGVAQVLVREIPGSSGAVAYCARGPWIDWSSADEADVMLGGMEYFARRHGAFVLKVESELPSGPGQPTRMLPSVEPALRRAIALVRGGTVSHAPHRSPVEDKRTEEARATILAARDQQERDGNRPGRDVFTARGYIKSRWDMQFRTTMVVDIDRTPDEMLARMKTKWRYNINLAARKGVEIVGDDSPAARETLYEMYARTASRDNFMLRPKAYFDRAWNTMIDAGYAHIFFAYREGQPLAALLAFTFGDKMWYQVGASETSGRNYMPAHALQFHAMAWAYEHGKRYYDLVAIPNLETIGPDESMWGLYVFKSGFGSRAVEWAGCLDKVLDPRGYIWESIEPAYYRLYRARTRDVMY